VRMGDENVWAENSLNLRVEDDVSDPVFDRNPLVPFDG